MIRFDDVTLSVPVPGPPGQPWGTKTLLDGITLDLPERRVALVGANGSGKSTLLRLINGLSTATAGRVEVDGIDPARDGKQARRRVGFVFTDPLSQLVMPTPLEDVELSLRAKIRDRTERRRAALGLLAARGLAQVAEQSIYDLSGGERQLVALTAVLAVEPSVLVADEPTTLLDLRNRIAFRRLIAELPQQMVIATHDLDLAADADRVLIVDQGRVVADGTASETLAHYERMMV
ncbi:MAG: ABC transporter ATP-binding protein [Propioniciclava sp.]|uniref:energy-coupling factor ABC transporter ATP-binding protein n=1 Tax=Propioniciclava sp. TaxID=2038686 RepID=UPI0039E3E988